MWRSTDRICTSSVPGGGGCALIFFVRNKHIRGRDTSVSYADNVDPRRQTVKELSTNISKNSKYLILQSGAVDRHLRVLQTAEGGGSASGHRLMKLFVADDRRTTVRRIRAIWTNKCKWRLTMMKHVGLKILFAPERTFRASFNNPLLKTVIMQFQVKYKNWQNAFN